MVELDSDNIGKENGELIIFTSQEGSIKIEVQMKDESVWLSLEQMATLFQRDKSTISKHIKNVFEEGELQQNSTVAKYATVQVEGDREVRREISLYNLDVIISIGYRVKSHVGTQFRIWANSVLKEYLIKGFAMNDELLKKAGGGDYFDELLARIRDIRSSEKIFWRKILDIYATSVDYDGKAESSVLFFKTVQNKMLYASTGQTAAEIIYHRADSSLPFMGMTTTKGEKITFQEAKTAKNYLQEEELTTLNHLVSAYLDLAELQAIRKKPMYMTDWVSRLDDYLRMTDSDVLENAGKISHRLAEQKAKEEYQKHKKHRKNEISPVEQAFLETIETVNQIEKRGKP